MTHKRHRLLYVDRVVRRVVGVVGTTVRTTCHREKKTQQVGGSGDHLPRQLLQVAEVDLRDTLPRRLDLSLRPTCEKYEDRRDVERVVVTTLILSGVLLLLQAFVPSCCVLNCVACAVVRLRLRVQHYILYREQNTTLRLARSSNMRTVNNNEVVLIRIPTS